MTKARKENLRIEKAIADKKKETPMEKVNKKLEKVGLPLKFVKSSHKVEPVATKSDPVGIVDQTTSSRKQLMEQAKEKGIKYFRILSRVELLEILHTGATPIRITAITEEAKLRWKNGWGSKKKEVVAA